MKLCIYPLLACAAVIPAFAESGTPERAVAVVLTGRGSNAAARSVEAGQLLFAGDTFIAGEATTVAFCNATRNDGVSLLLPRGGKFVFTAVNVEGKTGSPGFSGVVPVCVLPQIERNKTAENLTGTPDPEMDLNEIAARLGKVSESLAIQFRAAVAMGQEPRWKLLALTSEAATLEEARFFQEARMLYRQIRHDFSSALWTRSAISVLNQELIFGDLSPRVRPAGTPGVSGTHPDFSKGQTYALVFGISKYPEGKGPNLDFASHDAADFAAFLASDQGGKTRPENIKLLVDEAATRDAFEQSLNRLLADGVGKSNTLVIFVAGHGTYSCGASEQEMLLGVSAQTPLDSCDHGMNPYIIMRDGDREAPNITGYSMARLRDLVTEHASAFGRVLIFIDVCHGGNATWNVDVHPPLTNLDLISRLKASGGLLGILSGSEVAATGREAAEYAYESKQLQHGVFTFYLLKGLLGAAPVIQDSIPIAQLSSYVKSSVQSFTDLKTTPSDYATDGALPVVGNPNAEKKLDLHLVAIAGAEWLTKRGIPSRDDLRLEEALRSVDLLAAGPKIQEALDRIRSRSGESSREFQDAADRYRVALENQGQEVIARYLRGDQDPVPREGFERCGRLFRTALDIARDAAFDESRALFCEARNLLFRKNNDVARTALEQSIAIDPSRSYAYNALGISQLESANQDPTALPLAINSFLQAIRFEPKWAYPRHNLALALSESGRYADAVAVYRNAMVTAPDYSYLPYNLGLLFQTMRNYDESGVAYKLAIRIAEKRCTLRSLGPKEACPERALPRAAIASLAAQRRRRAKSEKLYREALTDAPSDLLIEHDLASLYAGWKGHQQQAEGIWKANLTQDSTHLPSLIGYTGLLRSQCRFADALPWLDQLTKTAKDYEPAKLDLALAKDRSGAPQDALAILTLLKSRSAEYWAVKAETSERLGERTAAPEEWKEAVTQSAGSPLRKSIQRRKASLSACPF